jgi:hypothetical protein
MRNHLHLAAIFLLTTATASRAQISNPDKLIAPPPGNPARQTETQPTTSGDLQWLWTFAQPAPLGRANDLRVDARFLHLLHTDFRQPQAVWGTNPAHPQPLDLVIPLFLSKYGSVSSAQNRYLSIDGCVPSFCAASGMLWVDLGLTHPLLVFVAVNWSTQGHATTESAADYNLWLFPSRAIDPDEIPFALTEAIAHWNVRLAAAHRIVPHIAHAVIVQPDGNPQGLDPELTGANTIAPQPDTNP